MAARQVLKNIWLMGTRKKWATGPVYGPDKTRGRDDSAPVQPDAETGSDGRNPEEH